jgi:uncharacterized membrane protein (UPF0127 family)
MAAIARLRIDGKTTDYRIRQAATWWSRAVGLLATRRLDSPCGLWLASCASVHTIGMRYAIDVVFLRHDGTIVKVIPELVPWRAAACRSAAATLELRAGLAVRLGLCPGMALALDSARREHTAATSRP